MADLFSPAKRSLIMAAIRSADTGPEIAVRKIVHRLGFRYRLHVRSLPGSPDLVFPSRRKVVFVHGCFWHRHPKCARATIPKTHAEFWRTKFASNVTRDHSALRGLKRMNWAPLTIWECELKKPERLMKRLSRFLSGE
jgi:DNA mismatch endonuclease (patch repair protein)